MKTVHRFVRTHHKITAFAEIGLELATDSGESLAWADDFGPARRVWGTAVASGLKRALDWHRQVAGGGEASFRVTHFLFTHVDTTSDAVECAATIAGWKALGHKESEIAIERGPGGWVVRRP